MDAPSESVFNFCSRNGHWIHAASSNAVCGCLHVSCFLAQQKHRNHADHKAAAVTLPQPCARRQRCRKQQCNPLRSQHTKKSCQPHRCGLYRGSSTWVSATRRVGPCQPGLFCRLLSPFVFALTACYREGPAGALVLANTQATCSIWK